MIQLYDINEDTNWVITKVDHKKYDTSMTWAKLSTKCVHNMIMWKSSAQLDIEWESLDYIMHEGSPKKHRIDKNTNWTGYRPCIPPGDLVTLHVPIWRWLLMISIEIEYQLKVFELKNTWYIKMNFEHITYDLRYGI